MSRRNLPSHLTPRATRLGLAVSALAIITACSDPGGDPPGVEPDATGAPDAGVVPDAAEVVADAAPDVVVDAAVPDAAPDAAPDAMPPGVDQLTAIVALSNCSGAVVRLKTSRPTDHALVLTNGHCIGGGGFLEPGEVVVGQPSMRRMSVLEPSALVPGPPMGPPPRTGVRVAVQASELVYATMTVTDMALYRLTITYAELESQGVHAMTMSDRHPAAGTAILIPSGYWRALFSCSIDAFVHTLREGEWTFEDSIRYTQEGCATIGGTSGSPIVATATHEVIGINNTANEGGASCSINNPCEVDPSTGDTTSVDDGRYGQQTYLLYGCLSPTNELDFDLPDCQLPRPAL